MDSSNEPPSARRTVAVLCTEDERDLPSEDNTSAARDVASALRILGHVVTVVPMRRPPPALRCDAVFNLCEGIDGDAGLEPLVAAWLELLGLPYTGNGPEALFRAFDKALVPGPTAPRFVATNAFFRRRVRFPAIVKPRFADASLGIDRRSVVRTVEELRARVAEVNARFGDAIVEEYVEGREFNVAILDGAALAVSEIDFTRLPADCPRIVTYAGKWEESSAEYRGTVPICPAEAPPEVAETALAAARELGCRGYARVDFRMDERGGLFVLEVNPNPDLSRGAGMARCAAAAGVPYEELIGRILDHAIRECETRNPSRGRGDGALLRRLYGEGDLRLSRDRGRRARRTGAAGL